MKRKRGEGGGLQGKTEGDNHAVRPCTAVEHSFLTKCERFSQSS